MNIKQEEFGDEAFLKTSAENHQLSAGNLINKLLEVVQNHVGSHPQHDDMTVVILKVK